MQVEIKRRSILKGSMAAGMLGVAAGAGLLTPRMVFAAWPKSAFEAKKVDEALTNLAGNNNLYFLNYLEDVKHNYGIYKSVFQSDKYSKPIPLPEQIRKPLR